MVKKAIKIDLSHWNTRRNKRVVKIVGWVLGISILIGVSLFSGLMVASAGIAANPSLSKMGAPWVCDGEYEITSRKYSYKPGQRGVEYKFYCIKDGKKEDITLPIIIANTLVYGVISLVFFSLLLFLGIGAGKILWHSANSRT